MAGLLVAVSLIAGAWFRFHGLGDRVYWNDEIWTSTWVTGRTSAEFEALLPREATTAGALRQALFAPAAPPARTLAVVAREDPKQPPLYMALAAVQAGLFGHSPESLRALSACFGLLGLIPLFLLCRELFPDRGVAGVAVALLAVSPFHVLYGQEARPYTLWIFLMFASSAALLRALRTGERAAWIVYGPAVALGLASHTLFVTVLAGHGLFVLHRGVGVPPGDRRRWLAASGLGVLLYAPWAALIALHPDRVAATTGWVIRGSGYGPLFVRWLHGLSSPFVDLRGGVGEGPALIAAACGALFAAASFVFAIRRAGRAGVFLAALSLPAALLVVPDVVLAGGGFSTPRFLVPLLAGCTIAAAYTVSRIPRTAARAAALALLVAAGLVSAAAYYGAPAPWTKYLDTGVPEAARLVNAAREPVVFGRFAGPEFRRLLALSVALRPGVAIRPVEDGPAAEGREAFTYGLRKPGAGPWGATAGLEMLSKDSRD